MAGFELFHQINQDAGNRVVILTGAGEAFIDRIGKEDTRNGDVPRHV